MPKRKKSNKLKDLAFEVARETITPELAIEYLDENNFERNRAISKQVVKEDAERIKGGTFAAGTEVVFAQVGDGLGTQTHVAECEVPADDAAPPRGAECDRFAHSSRFSGRVVNRCPGESTASRPCR